MKQIISGIIMTAIAFMVIISVMTISGRGIRKNELEKALEHAAEQAMKELEKQTDSEVSREEMLETVLENLSMGLESDSEITVSVMAANPEKGILSVRAEGVFQNPLGKPDKVTVEKTLILESYHLEKKGMVTITYQVEGKSYKVYSLVTGSEIPVPVNPEEDFLGWMDENGMDVNIENVTADSDRTFTARIKEPESD